MKISIDEIKKLGLKKDRKYIYDLVEMYNQDYPLEIRREIVSSIGRQKDNKLIFSFIKENYKKKDYMEVIYQMYRTCLYKSELIEFNKLGEEF